jgi:hypothetical protein
VGGLRHFVMVIVFLSLPPWRWPYDMPKHVAGYCVINWHSYSQVHLFVFFFKLCTLLLCWKEPAFVPTASHFITAIVFNPFLSFASLPDLCLPTHSRWGGYCCPWHTHFVGLLWRWDRPVAETSTWQHATLKTHTSMLPAGFEAAISGSEQLQVYALDRAATGIGPIYLRCILMLSFHLRVGI